MKTNATRRESKKQGIVLFAVMSTVAGLAIIGAVAFNFTRTDFGIAFNHRYEAESFAQADAATQYAKAQIEAQLAAGTLTLTNAAITSVAVNYPAPSGYYFDTITNITRSSSGSYYFTVYGRASNNARSAITTAWKQRSAIAVGAFGYRSIDIKADGYVYSYYSSSMAGYPTPADSTGDADAASDILFTTHVGTTIDGDLLLGATSSGTAATWVDPGGGSIISGYEGQLIGHIDPDPLGLLTSPLGVAGNAMLAASTVNNNLTSAMPPIVLNQINLGNGDTMTLNAGTYYLSSLIVGGNATLNINGKVDIYVTGNVDLKVNSNINFANKPTDMSLYCNNTANNASVIIYNSASFQGLVYAPKATVEIKNSGNFYGAVWGNNVELKNSGSIFIDLSLIQKYLLPKIYLVNWKQER